MGILSMSCIALMYTFVRSYPGPKATSKNNEEEPTLPTTSPNDVHLNQSNTMGSSEFALQQEDSDSSVGMLDERKKD
jgi:hypothetical protein